MEFFVEAKNWFVALHLLGLAFGLGGATIADVLFFRFLKDLQISEKESEALSVVSKMVFFGLALLILSGLGIFLSAPETYMNSSKFLIKMFIVLVVSLNGLILHKVLHPRLQHIVWRGAVRHRLRNYRKMAFACGAVSVSSWYLAFMLGMLKSIPLSFWWALLCYFVVLFFAVLVSQFVENVWSRA